MSTGGIFTLITNDGKQDRMLMATELLKARLRRIMKARAAEGMDPTPTLVDIEKTHVLFMNAHFKPFAAIGYEYNKVRPSTGGITLNSTVQFSIPQFGDFFHDMVLHVRLSAVTTTTAGNWRWCDYPGERLLDKVRFTVNGNPLDEYYGQDYNFYRQFELSESKRSGYNRCAGQQEPMDGLLIPSDSDAVNLAAHTAAGFGANAAALDDSAQFWVRTTDGYQTVKTEAVHATASTVHQRTDILEVTMPLLFWFNRDPRLAIPSVSIPFGQRYVECDLTAFANLAQGVAAVGASHGTAPAAVLGTPTVPVCDLYVNNIFVNPEVHDIFIKRIGFNLIRVHRRQVNRISDASNGELLLNNFKWPIESIYFGFRHTSNSTAAGTNNYLEGWHRFAECQSVSNAFVFGGATTSDTAVQYNKLMPVVSQVTFQAHGIPIYNAIPAIMYNQYFPWAYGDKLSTPDDPGAYCVTFNLYPGVYQPSGHINVSRAREFYVKYDDSVTAGTHRNLGTPVASGATADFLASANALNFLLISDGSAVLRYST